MLVRGSAVDHDGAGIVRPSPPRAPRPASLRWDRSPGQRRAGTTMAPAASRLRTEAALAALPRRALAHYLLLLRLYPVLAKAASRFLVTGPLSHYFYLFMEHWIPPEVPLARVKRLLLDRFVFAPAFLLLFFLIMNLLEGKDANTSAAKIRRSFWPALRTNWQMWTPLQFINISYVPVQFRVLFANLAALFWYAYLACLGK
ncbi:peroxisomal membrane protein 2 isoform X2 [Castor canadensis]|uniref:Peroxisomal membrane protein 2 isoform X2 n=1 Tax=Castor canadensis TaxID=51338 RepID=A0AC58LIK4_CASCN